MVPAAGGEEGRACPARVQKRTASPCAVGRQEGRGGRGQAGHDCKPTPWGVRAMGTGSGASPRSKRWGREGLQP